MKPFGNNILVKPDEMPTQHKGLFIPDSARKPNFKGTVVAVGQGLYNSPMKLKVGDYIMYDSATPVQDHIITSQKNILGLIK